MGFIFEIGNQDCRNGFSNSKNPENCISHVLMSKNYLVGVFEATLCLWSQIFIMSPEYEPSSLMRRDEVCVPLGFGLHKNVDYDYLPS